MPRLYFDTNSASLEEISEIQEEQAQIPPSLQRLSSLLLREEFDFKKGDFPTISLGEWSASEGIAFGEIIAEDLSRIDPVPALKKEMVWRLHVLGLFPDYNFVRKQYGTLHHFVEKIGAKHTYDYSAYDQLSREELLEDIVEKYEESGFEGPLSYSMLQVMHQVGLAPGRKYLLRRIGGVRKINELLGYPDVRSWVEDDFLNYGANIFRYNGPLSLTKTNADLLASRKLGASSAECRRRFGSWGRFKNLASERFSSEIIEEENHKNSVNEHYQNINPQDFDEISFDEKARHRALWILVEHYTPDAKSEIPTRIQPATIEKVLSSLQKTKPQVTRADIEIMAITFNVFDDLWPAVDNRHKPILNDASNSL